MVDWLQMDENYSARLRLAADSRQWRRVAIFLAHSGDSWFWGLGLLVVFWLGTWEWKAVAIKLVISIAVVAMVVQLTKSMVRRKRPDGEWGQLYRRTDPHSFPSGHAARLAMLTVVCALWNMPWAAALLVIWTPLVAWARVALGLHYLSDVIGGSFLGICIGCAIGMGMF